MANYLCRTIGELPSYMQAQIIVPEDATLYAGDIYVANNLNEKLRGNVLTYDVEVVSDIKTQVPIIVINPVNNCEKPINRPSAKVSTSLITILTISPGL